MELEHDITGEAGSDAISDGQLLNTVKHRVRDVIRALDASGKVYLDSLESHQLKHEVLILLSELQVHGLLPETVSLSPIAIQQHE